MPTDTHIFIKKVTDENPSIDAELLSAILSSKFMSPEFSGVKNIVEMLSNAHKLALKIQWPISEQTALLERYNVLLDVKNTSVYKNDYSIELIDPFLNRISEFPFAALFSQQFHRKVTTEQKDILLLLVIMFFQILLNSNSNNKYEEKTLVVIADSLRKLISEVDENHLYFTYNLNFKSFKYQRLQAVLERLTQDDELKLHNDFSSIWADVSRLFIDVENEEQDNVNRNLVYGSRLTTCELMQLSLRSNVLAEHESRELVSFIQQRLIEEESSKPAIVSMVVALTSKPFGDILNIKLFSKKPLNPANDYIDMNSGTWVRESIKMPDSYSQSENEKMCLSQHTKWLHLSLPEYLIDVITLIFNSQGVSEGTTIGELCGFTQPAEKVLSGFLKPFWKNNLLIHRRITPALLRGLMFNQLIYKHDAEYAALLLANTEYINPTTLYYLSAKAIKLAGDYHAALAELGIETEPSKLNTNAMVGSELVLNANYINTVITKKNAELSHLLEIDSAKLSFDELIARHNLFSNYLTTMLLASTGHRERTEFGFSPYVWDEEAGYLLLSDKVNFTDSAVRMLPLSNIVIEQLSAYKNFCKDTAKRIAKFNCELANKIVSTTESPTSKFPTISYLIPNDVRPINSTDTLSYLAPDINVPINCFRHFLCQHLSDSVEFNSSSLLMGHINNGEHLLSDFSCASIADLKLVTTPIDNLLVKLGFKVVVCKPPRGPKYAVEKSEIGEGYRADYLFRSESKELKVLNKWGKEIFGSHTADLLNIETREKTRNIIVNKAEEDESSGIGKKRRLYWLNKQIFNTLEKGELRFTTEMTNLHVEVNLLLKMQQSRKVKSSINDLLFHECVSKSLSLNNEEHSSEFQLVKVFLSLIVNAKANISANTNTMKVIQASPVFENGIAWFDFDKGNRVIIDSISLMLILKSSSYKNAVFSKNTFDKLISEKYLAELSKGYLFNFIDINAHSVFASLDKLAKYIRESRDENQNALAFSYQNNYFKTTSLSQVTLTRWLSAEPVNASSKQKPVSQENINSLNYISSINSKNKCFNKSQKFLKTIQRALDKQNKDKKKVLTSELLIREWGEFIGCKNVTSVGRLIEKSDTLNDVAILLIMWAIDISKKKNKSGRLAAVRTPKTHLSNVAQPLLSQFEHDNILDLTSDELANIYKNAINVRAVKSKGARASEFRRFHHFLEMNFDLQPLDWHEIEPTISFEEEVNANIISMTEYSNMMSVLNKDEQFSVDDKNINQIILMLCYRLGLRVGEAVFLKLQDIDTENWIVHVRSYYHHRLKSSAANRRIPVSLLLSNDEKALLIRQINRVKSHHLELNSLWLFSDKVNAQCRVDLKKNLGRVRETIRLVSGDDTLCLHHCRHSFANYLLLCMNHSYYPVAITNELRLWTRTSDLAELSVKLRQSLLSKKSDKRQILHALAKVMGHSSPKTTLCHYIHVLDIIHASENEKCIFNIDAKHENHPAFIKKRKHPCFALLNLKQANCNKILSRNDESLGYQSLIAHAQKSWIDYQRTAVSRAKRKFTLSDITLNKQQQRLSELYDIEHIIRASERGLSNVRIAHLYQLDFQFVTCVVKNAIHLKKELSYSGIDIAPDKKELTFETNNRKLLTSSKYIRMPSFQVLLQKVAEVLKDRSQAKDLSNIWQQSYEKNRGLIIAHDDYKKFTPLVSSLGYKITNIDENARVKRKCGYKTGILVKFYLRTDTSIGRSNGDNKIHHGLFLLSMYLLTKTDDIII
jgi:integrase